MPKKLITKIIFVSTLLSGLILGSGIAVAQSQTGLTSIQGITADYYLAANSLVNSHFQNLFQFFEDLNLEDPELNQKLIQALTPPEADFSLNCATNLTSSCLQFKLTERYLAYEKEISSLSNTINQNQLDFIQEQKNIITVLNQQSIEFYRQVLFSYPVHLQNQQMIQGLEQLLATLKQVEDSFQPYTNVFHNVTTAYCQ